jgi:cytosine/adenosine deaminase-related metal-dependent hydrolase
LREAGMPELDILRALTSNAAEMLGWQDRIGAVEPGSSLSSSLSVQIRSLTSARSSGFGS